MELSLEFAEKYFWTWLDFWRFGPRQFSKSVVEERPQSYASPFQFFMASLLIAAIAWTVAYATLSEIPQTLAVAKHIPRFTGDIKTAILRRGFVVFLLLLIGILPELMILKWPLKSPASIKDLLIARFYGTGVLIVAFASVDTLVSFPVLWVAENVSDRNAAIVLLGWILGELLIFMTVATYYQIATMSAFARLRRRRYLEGSLFVIFVAPVLYGVSISALCIYLTVRERTPDYLVVVGVSMSLLALFVLYVKRRLPTLRRLVQSEYSSYWSSSVIF